VRQISRRVPVAANTDARRASDPHGIRHKFTRGPLCRGATRIMWRCGRAPGNASRSSLSASPSVAVDPPDQGATRTWICRPLRCPWEHVSPFLAIQPSVTIHCGDRLPDTETDSHRVTIPEHELTIHYKPPTHLSGRPQIGRRWARRHCRLEGEVDQRQPVVRGRPGDDPEVPVSVVGRCPGAGASELCAEVFGPGMGLPISEEWYANWVGELDRGGDGGLRR
jgi:hypothetical protein